MSLKKPLTTSLVRPLLGYLDGTDGSNVLPDGATLDHYWPLASDLICKIDADPMTLTRASTSTVTSILTGDPIVYQIDEPAYNGEGGGDAIGLGFGASPDNLQIPSTTWAQNNCWIYLKITGLTKNGSTQRIFDCGVDSDNFVRLNYSQSGGNLQLLRKSGGAFYSANLTYDPVTDGGDFEIRILNLGASGMSYETSLPLGIASNPSDIDFEFRSTCMLGNNVALTAPCNAYFSNFKRGIGSITLEQARDGDQNS